MRRPPLVRRLPRLLALLAKALFQLATLLWMLLVALPRPDAILLQLPPAIPTVLVCRLAALRHRARLVFDWHNFAYTLMAIGMGRGHPVVSGVRPRGRASSRRRGRHAHSRPAVRSSPAVAPPQVQLAERYERYWGRAAHASLCVTRAMQVELAWHWAVPATVFYDRPPDFFRPASLQARCAALHSGPTPALWAHAWPCSLVS